MPDGDSRISPHLKFNAHLYWNLSARICSYIIQYYFSVRRKQIVRLFCFHFVEIMNFACKQRMPREKGNWLCSLYCSFRWMGLQIDWQHTHKYYSKSLYLSASDAESTDYRHHFTSRFVPNSYSRAIHLWTRFRPLFLHGWAFHWLMLMYTLFHIARKMKATKILFEVLSQSTILRSVISFNLFFLHRTKLNNLFYFNGFSTVLVVRARAEVEK